MTASRRIVDHVIPGFRGFGCDMPILLWLTLFLPAIVSAAPSITGTQSALMPGIPLVIDGSDFGPDGPNVVFFDDLEQGIAGNTVRTGSGSAALGVWNSVGSNAPYYTTSAAISGSKAMQTNMSVNWLGYAEILLPTGTQELFGSWWMYVPSGTNIPGEGTSDGTNWKTVWLQGSGTTNNDLVIPTRLSSGWLINGNDSPFTESTSIDLQKGEWKRVWAWIKSGQASNGHVHFWELDGAGIIKREEWDNRNVGRTGEDWERLRINGYGRTTTNSFPTFDDIYVATGPNARARIEIGDRPVYAECTKLAVATPTSWSTTSITATPRQGNFSIGETAYLFVFDAAGIANTTGFAVAWSNESGDPGAPGQPGQPIR